MHFCRLLFAHLIHTGTRAQKSAISLFDDKGIHFNVSLVNYGGVKLLIPSMDSYISRFVRATGTFDPKERDYLLGLVSAGDKIIEVGANIGPYSVYLARALGEEGHLLCFEPFKLLYQILTANVALNGISNTRTFQIGLAARPKKALLVEGPNLKRTDNYGASSLLDESSRPWTFAHPEIQAIELGILDDYIKDTPSVSLVKIDVEGMEFEVLQGAQSLIRRDSPIIYAENSMTNKAAGGKTFEDFMSDNFGYICDRPRELWSHNIVICKKM